MAHRNRWFTELNSMVFFHGELLNNQMVSYFQLMLRMIATAHQVFGWPGWNPQLVISLRITARKQSFNLPLVMCATITTRQSNMELSQILQPFPWLC